MVRQETPPKRLLLPWLLMSFLTRSLIQPWRRSPGISGKVEYPCPFPRATASLTQLLCEGRLYSLADSLGLCRIWSFLGNIGRNEPYHCGAENHVEVQGWGRLTLFEVLRVAGLRCIICVATTTLQYQCSECCISY